METFSKGQKVTRRRQSPDRPATKGYISILRGSTIGKRPGFSSGKPGIPALARREPFTLADYNDKVGDLVRLRPSRPHTSPRSVKYTAPFINLEALRVGWRKLTRSFRVKSGFFFDTRREKLEMQVKRHSDKTISFFNGITQRIKTKFISSRSGKLSEASPDFLASLAGISAVAAIEHNATAAATSRGSVFTANGRFRGNLLEPAWLLFVDSIPSRAARTTEKIINLATKTPGRFLALIVIPVVAAMTLSSVISFASQPAFPLPGNTLLPDETTAQQLLLAYVSPESLNSMDDSVSSDLPAIPVSLETRRYVVRSGENLASVARKFHLRQDTIISINNIRNSSGFRVGMELKIPNMDGIAHRVRPGENLPAIVKKYRADMTKLVDTNNLANASLKAGSDLFIPGAKLAPSALQGFYAIKMVWPARGRISSPFGYRSNPFTGMRTFHAGLDIVISTGTPIKTIMDGMVADSGYNGTFGNYIIITHTDNYQTLYGHLNSIGVRKGQQVTQGSVIGRSGNSGYSTGPHLHFGLFKKGIAINPAKLLK